MTTILTRTAKGSAITNTEMDTNFNNLNNFKVEDADTRSTVKPSLVLDFANTKQLDPRVTFSRASTATYYDGKTVAKAEENLFLSSQELDGSNWAQASTVVTANAGVSPDGTTTADLCVPNTVSAAKAVRQAIPTVAGLPYAYSVFVKASGYNFVQIANSTGFSPLSNYTNFNLTSGTIGNTTGNMNASIVSVGNGWYRISVVVNATTTGTSQFLTTALPTDDPTRSPSFVGDGTSGVLMWGMQVEQRSSVTAYTPTTTAPITRYVPQLLTARVNEPRFEHNPVTGESLGLEIEEQRTNLLVNSDLIGTSNAALLPELNSQIAPDGSLSADKIVATSVNTEHYSDKFASVTAGTTYTFSVFAKASDTTRLTMRFASRGSAYVFFNLNTGIASAGLGVDFLSSSITPVGNGWYRCSLTFTAATTGTATIRCMTAPEGTNTFSHAGDDFSGYFIWGWQLEAGSFATSYIPTGASTATRSADSAIVGGSSFSSFYRQDEGTFYADYFERALSSSHQVTYVLGSSANERINIGINAANFLDGQVVSGSVDTFSGNAPQLTAENYKVAFAYKTNDTGISVNASAVTTDSAVTLPANMSQLNLGTTAVTTQSLNSTIKRIAYYPKRLSNTTLQNLTS